MRQSALAAALTLVLLAPFTAQAGTKTHERLRIVGNSAYADWDSVNGDIETYVSVVVTDNNESGTAGRSEFAFVALAINQWDNSTQNVRIAGVAYVDGPENFDFSIDK